MGPEELRGTYTARVEQLIEAKAKDEEVVVEEEPETPGKVVDLLEALQASIDEAKGHKPGNRKQATKLKTHKPGEKSKDSETPEAESVADLSRAELNELAKELEISGRSKMSRKELAKAVTAAGKKEPSKSKPRKKAS